MFGRHLTRLVASVENHGARLSRDETVKLANGRKLHRFSVVRTEPGKQLPFLNVAVIEFADADDGYELLVPVSSAKITTDVEAICGLGAGEGTLVD
jgi:hypothetical protein